MARMVAIGGIISKDWIIFPISLIVVLLDQLSKAWVRDNFIPGQSLPETGLVRLTFYTNTGAAFGLFPNQTVLFVVVAIFAIAIIALFYRRLPKDAAIVRVGLGLQLGGATGNLIDRVVHGYVTDFIDVAVWPVFNLADSAIVTGVILLAYFLLFDVPKEPETVKADGPEQLQEK